MSNLPKVVSRDEWLAARKALLAQEKELTRARDALAAKGLPVDEWEQPFDLHGLSVFLRVDDEVFHTYSAYARGTDGLAYVGPFLDLTALGRQEEWEEPKGRATAYGAPAGSER